MAPATFSRDMGARGATTAGDSPAFVPGSKCAGETDWDPAAEDDPDLIPPSPSRVFFYRAWFGAIMFLEYAVVRKQIQLAMVFSSFREKHSMRHPWVSIAMHVAVDSVALWFLNAFPGSKRCGTRRAVGGEKGKRVTLVPASVPILARHVAKMISRVQPVSIWLLGARVFHGYTLKQTLLIVVSPTFFNVAGGAIGGKALAAMSAVNVAVVLVIVRFNRDAFEGYPELFDAFKTTVDPERTFYATGVPAVAAAPFFFAFLFKMDAVTTLGDALWRLHARVYFGGQNALGPETEIDASPATIVPLARRLRAVARRVVPLAAAANAMALAHALFAEPLSKTAKPNVGVGVERALVAAMAACFLAAAARVPWGAFDAFASADKWRGLYWDTRNAAERAALTFAGSYAALSATACAAVTRSEGMRAAPETTSRVAAAWLATWCLVFACACAATPSPAPWRAARAAALGLAVAAAGVATVDDAAFDAAAAGVDAAALAKALFGAYMCALHAAAAWSAAARGFSFFDGADAPARKEAAAELDGHWKSEDFEIDASRFKVRARRDPMAEIDAQYDYAPVAHAPPRSVAEELAAAARARELADSDARDAFRRAPRCRAEGCDAPVGFSANALAEGLSLCCEHLVAEAPFQCAHRGGPAHFCVLCRRVHAPPRCAEGTLCDGSGRVGVTEREAYTLRRDAPDTAGLRSRASARRGGFRDVSFRAWYKTQEGPAAATARMRGVVSDFAAALPAGARALHAEVAVRPGCTLLTVDIGARLREDDGALGSTTGDAAPERGVGDDEACSPEENPFSVCGDAARAFAAAGAKHGLDGVLDFVVVNPVSGRSMSRNSPPESDGDVGVLSGFRRRLAFDRREGKLFESAVPKRGFFRGFEREKAETDSRTSRFPIFEWFGAFGAFGAETRDDLDGNWTSDVMRSKMSVLRSDTYDVLTLPSPPEGYTYALQCGGTYIPLLLSDSSSRRVVAHITPTNAEGLGFIELVADADTSPTTPEVSPLVSTAVFLTPDPALAAELARVSTGARAEHTPMLFNIGAAITGRASGAAVGAADGCARDAAEVREEIVFHAACAAASAGWSVAARRVVDKFDADADLRGQSSRNSGALAREYGTDFSAMSENPDTATDDFYSELETETPHAAAPNQTARPELGTRAGAATLLRAACRSGDVATVSVATAWVIRRFGAVVASDLLASGDATGIGGNWTPLHASADAVAGATARRGVSSAACATRAAVHALVVSADPLSWVAAGGASPSAVLRRGGVEEEGDPRRLAAMDEKVLDELASAVVCAVAHLRDVATTEEGPSERFARHVEAPAHFTAAAAAATLAYDGSCAHTMAVALLSPGSSRAWDAFRARALDTARGDVSLEEAKTWLRGGSRTAGFPPPTPREVCTRVYGEKAVACLALIECVARFFALFHSLRLENAKDDDDDDASFSVSSPGSEGKRGHLEAAFAVVAIAAPAVAAVATAFLRLNSRTRRRAPREISARLAALAAEGVACLIFAFVAFVANVAWNAETNPGVASFRRVLGSIRIALALVVSTLAPAKAFAAEASLVAAAASASGFFRGFQSPILIGAATVSFACAAAAATRRCVPLVARAHVDKLTAEAMFGTKAKAA